MQTLVEFCNSHADFALPSASELVLPTRYKEGGYITKGSLHEIALRAILVDQCPWYQTFASVQSRLAEGEGSIVCFGLERCIPHSYIRSVSHRAIHMADVETGKSQLGPIPNPAWNSNDDRIAVVGMSCRVPGANDLEAFWNLLCENKSQHTEVPSQRFTFETAWRDVDPQRKWFGNFVEDFDAFDNKFFNKTPREAGAMDPQQKMMMQAAYQAVEQSGYYQSADVDKHIGCYIGVSNVDYQDNVACHPVSAFTATGTLMSFVAGKVSHYFGWTGPSMSIDTACSGSAVAIHEACNAILSGDCTTALAGGVNAITSPLWFQNLAGASFLSTTGQCKPFDVKGDGYCRGEAVGAVFLKRLSAAVRDGDPIFGTIAATAVQQNQNCTAITVPNSPSLSDLFTRVTNRAKINPRAITVVEAHGTGTAVGDPAEYEGIRKTLGGPNRSSTLALASVKGLIGHAECASGMVALIKTLLMINEGAIAPQASHDTINPALHASSSDMIEIPKNVKPWNAAFKAALINNYGASGSNASMVITEAPSRQTAAPDSLAGGQQPFWFCGADDQSLDAYVSRFLSFLRSKRVSARNVSVPNLSYNMSRQSNRSLDRALIFHADSVETLENKLESYSRGEVAAIDAVKPGRPLILCFGGQVSTFVGLDRHVFERTSVLRKHLDQCDLVCKSIGLPGIYPDIFRREPIEDTVQLQTALFSLQYSCARSWIECGIQVSAMVGHSFGEIVAQTVAGALSLTDGLKAISRRASLIRDYWGSDRGAMMAVEADLNVLEDLLARANKDGASERPATIACYNGPRSFTIAGSTDSIQRVESAMGSTGTSTPMARGKRLNTSHAFHSTLVEPLIPELKQIMHDITFSQPSIRVERATMTTATASLTTGYFAEHLRQPVYFDHAVQRLAKEFDGAVWLEAGSQSTITKMASKALSRPKSSHFQEINLTSDDSWLRLTEATVDLWKQGLRISFWPHHSSQASQYAPVILPPYQFKKAKHFLELKAPQKGPASSDMPAPDDQPRGIWAFMGYQDPEKQCARFRVETSHEDFQELMAGHTVAHSQPLCPSTLQLDIATEAIRSICPQFPISDYQVDLRCLENQSPLCRDASRVVWLDVVALDESRQTWSWKMVSNRSDGKGDESLHASGKTIFRSRGDVEFLDEFRRFGRLITHKRCQEMLDNSDYSDDILQGSAIYKLFADVVDYSETFRGVRKVVGRGGESAGRVVKKYSAQTLIDTPLCDSFCQVAGMFVNCMTQRPESDAFISSGVERLVQSPFIRTFEENPEVFDVFAIHHRPTDRSYSSDVFIFDTRTSELLGVILGIQYQRVSKLAMSKLLQRLTPGSEPPRLTVDTSSQVKKASSSLAPAEPAQKQVSKAKPAEPAGSKVADKIIAVLCEMIGVEPGQINDSTNLPDLGIDSLMGMEVARELELAFKCTLDASALTALTMFGDLVKFISSTLGEGGDDVDDEQHDDTDGASVSSESVAGLGFHDGSGDIPGTPTRTDTSLSSGAASPKLGSDVMGRQMTIDSFVAKYASGFSFSQSHATGVSKSSGGHCVLVTGATGSLGAHLVQHFAELPSVASVVCFNRASSMEPMARQRLALTGKGIALSEKASAKLQVVASNTSKPLLGLDGAAYAGLAGKVTHVVHAAWPMSITRTIFDFEDQFAAMRNLIDLARDASVGSGHRVGFQFVSSIATVGLYPVVTGQNVAPEEPSKADYALPSGYSDSKLVCERLLAQTLGRHPDRASAASVRVGQVAGSRASGYWNPAEHFSLLIKSAQTVGALPDLPGDLSWLPVEDVAAALADLSLCPPPPGSEAPTLYHVENPARQPWSEVISVLKAELGIPSSRVVPYYEWLDIVRHFSPARDADNPAKKVMKFLEEDFLRMACGGLVLGTEKAVKVSETLRAAEPVQEGLVKSYLGKWKAIGFLS